MPKKNKKTSTKKTVEKNIAGNFSEVIFSWETTDFIKSPKMDFYLLAAIFGAIIMVVWGIYEKNFLTVVVFSLLAAVSILTINEEPRKIKVKISEHGIDFENKSEKAAKQHYEFSEFKTFWISHSGEIPVLNLKPKKPYLPVKIIYLENEPEKDLEDFLEIYLPKEEKK